MEGGLYTVQFPARNVDSVCVCLGIQEMGSEHFFAVGAVEAFDTIADAVALNIGVTMRRTR